MKKTKKKNNNKPINKKPGVSETEEQEKSIDTEREEPEKKGKLLMDTTVAEQRIKYPNLELLSDARRICETIIDNLYPFTGLSVKPRTYRKVAHKEFFINFSYI